MKKENFSRAMNEMFGVGSDTPVQEPAAEPVMAPAPDPFTAAPEPLMEEPAPVAAPVAPGPVNDYFNAPSNTFSNTASFSKPSTVKSTILSPGTTFVGNMTSVGDVDMDCDFQGDIETTGAITLRTKLLGDLTASVVDLVACEVQGDIHASTSVRIDSKSKVVGNIYTKDLMCAGAVQGNIQSTGHVTVTNSAYLEGDIEAASISVESGAGINGQVQVLPRSVQ